MLKIIDKYKSPNCDARPKEAELDSIIIHYTNMPTAELAIERLCHQTSVVSAHYLISKGGEIFGLVDEEKRAWHAGVSFWDGRANINDYSIGIELDNNGDEVFSDLLMESLIRLCKDILKRRKIKPCNIVGHQDIAPGRKEDPGKYFNWEALAENDIGLFPKGYEAVDLAVVDISSLQKKLAAYGYKIIDTGKHDKNTMAVIKAFNNHFYKSAHENWDNNTVAILDSLLEMKESTK